MRGITIAMPACEPDHPPLSEWPTRNLVRGTCPRCGYGRGFATDKGAARMLRARRLIETVATLQPEEAA